MGRMSLRRSCQSSSWRLGGKAGRLRRFHWRRARELPRGSNKLQQADKAVCGESRFFSFRWRLRNGRGDANQRAVEQIGRTTRSLEKDTSSGTSGVTPPPIWPVRALYRRHPLGQDRPKEFLWVVRDSVGLVRPK